MEEQRRKIVVAVDEGEESMYALEWCLKNVVDEDHPRDTLILLYAVPHRAIYTPMDGTGYLFSEEIVESMEIYSRDVAEAVLSKAKSVCADAKYIKVETKLQKGDPRDVICEVVDSVGADILVMGSHGYGILKRAFIGSVSNHCAQNAKCPVLIVKRPESKH